MLVGTPGNCLACPCIKTALQRAIYTADDRMIVDQQKHNTLYVINLIFIIL